MARYVKERVLGSLDRVSRRLGFDRDWTMIVLGAAVGSITALGAIGFDLALHWMDEVTRAQMAMSIWLLPLIPALGGLATGFLVTKFAADAKGHGVPPVMAAIIRKRGVIRLRVGIVKTLASICTVGSGGSAGAEGPIVQIGSTAGSVIGQKLGISGEKMTTLVGCGAAAGIASIFHAPIAGVLFVLEILLRDFSLRTFAPIVIAAVLSSAVTQAVQGAEGENWASQAIFATGDEFSDYSFNLAEMPAYVALGLLCGLLAVLYGRALHATEDVFDGWKAPEMLKPAIGAGLMGVLGIGFVLAASGDSVPAFFGNGYDTIRELLSPDYYQSGASQLGSVVLLLGALIVAKTLATCLTLGSGGSGGTFAPSLFLGAAAGGLFGVLLDAVGLMPADSTPASFALVGMAALLAGAMHAPLTAILIAWELTQNQYVFLPVMLAAVLATVLAQLIDKDSMYTASLRRAGVIVGRVRDTIMLRQIGVSECEVQPLPSDVVYASDPLSKLVALHAYNAAPDFVVIDQDGGYLGMVTGADMRAALVDREAIPLLLVAELLRDDIPVVLASERLDTVMEKFARHDISSMPVLHDEISGGRDSVGKPMGLLTRSAVFKRYMRALEAEE